MPASTMRPTPRHRSPARSAAISRKIPAACIASNTMTTNNVLGCELVLMTGEIIRLGGKHLDSGGYDLMGIVTGSEGLLGLVTEITVRILKKPQTARAALLG